MNPRLFTVLIMMIMLSAAITAQRAKIVTEAVTPHRMQSLGIATNSVASGLDVFGKETYIYFSAKNIANADPVLSADYELISRPSGSTAALEASVDPLWTMFKADLNGAYQIKLTITTAAGTHDTTKTVYAANFVGVGNYEGVAAQYPNCMTCHQNTPKFVEIFDRWKVSGHATKFKRDLIGGSAHFSTNCLKCHTVGYDHNMAANNNGFDDLAAQLGWQLIGPPSPAKWDSLVTYFPGLVNHATIGCESCHGPGGEHANGANPSKIQISLEAGVCGQCHDEPWRHNKYAQFENSVHAEAVWTNSFAQGASSQNNNLQNCIRCHDGRGFVNFTKGLTTNTTGMISASQTKITCATCHDPHGNSNIANLRLTPAGSDTLANGYAYGDFGGAGNLCMNCHKTRRDASTYSLTQVTNANWGPHYNNQTDILLGMNAAQFGETPYLTSPHKYAIENTCVTCHMPATVDTGNVNRDKVGGHTWSLHNAETGFDYTKACQNCHGVKESFNSFVAKYDYDGNGVKGSIQEEYYGLVKNLKKALPPVGIDSISWQMIRDTNDVNINKAYYNYRVMGYDKSKGMHNTNFTFDVLRRSTQAIGGFVTDVPISDDLIPEEFSLSQNYPNPFNPITKIEYKLPFESKIKLTIYSITGEVVRELINDVQGAGVHSASFNAGNLASGIYFYRIEAKSTFNDQYFAQTKKMVLVK